MKFKGWFQREPNKGKCIDKGKNCYDKKTAQSMMNHRHKRGAKLRIYHCPLCNWWHLTHHPKNSDEFNKLKK